MQNKKQKSIYGIGVDICNVGRMHEKITRNGDNFVKKILTSYEYSIYCDSSNKAQYVAKCWAVKEAFVKAMGTGFNSTFTYATVGYFSPVTSISGNTRPRISLSEDIQYSNLMRNKTVHLSVSDEKDNVVAFVTIEEEKI